MNTSSSDMMWVVEREMQTCMSRFPVHFDGQFRTSLHNQNIQEKKGIINFHFHCEFDGEIAAVLLVHVAKP
jgi:hypothetical protein